MKTLKRMWCRLFGHGPYIYEFWWRGRGHWQECARCETRLWEDE